MQAYFSDPKRETDPHALPDVEVFWFDGEGRSMPWMIDGDGAVAEQGWYWWSCFPGCMPDSEPFGPFDTEQEAIEDAQDF